MLVKFIKGVSVISLAGVIGLSMTNALPQHLLTMPAFAEEAIPRFDSNSGSEFEPGTLKFDLQVGDKGQIRRPKDSPLKDFNYSFRVYVDDPSIISFDEQGNWVAHKAGKTRIFITFPNVNDGDHYKKYEEELKQNPVEIYEKDLAVFYQVAVTDSNAPATLSMHRLYNPNNKEHFYTASANELDTLVRIGWGKYEGVAWQAPVTGTPVYRLYHPSLKDHHYTQDTNEVKVLSSKQGWIEEGIAWYSAGEKPIYRLYHPGLTSGSHHFTGDMNEINALKSSGWEYEGVSWYAQ